MDDGVKMISSAYIEFLQIWFKVTVAFKWKIIFKHNNAVANATVEYLGKLRFKNDRLMVYFPCFLNINPIKNL